ncbi:hypothetical protein [Oryzihumus leptocrescens]|uniref:Uncharacterized protein n=1 Tax=Oryzihumus leptocrescens TaxID=297536 RepID=A0A542Z7M8_9MICO|nr:hypothetical protein [Oryzihumus leptocrescens]TQL56341.1 hypothetical protein FB474_3957 [Oryzihumus leptocrescens]
MILPRHPSGDQDDDPTGVRALLSALPEPEPMPEDLVRRISASLAAEQSARPRADVSVTPLLPTRRTRRFLLPVAAVAAGIAAVALAGTGILHLGSGSSTSSGSAASAGAQLAATDDPTRKAASGAGAAQHIQVSTTRYTAPGFATQAGHLAAVPAPGVAPLTGEAPAVGPIATPRGLADCLAGLGVGPVTSVTADIAFYDAQPAVVLVVLARGARTAYAVGRSCSATDPHVLHGATPLP